VGFSLILVRLHNVTTQLNPFNAELNPICHLLALLGAHHILHVSRVRVNPSVCFFSNCAVIVFVLTSPLSVGQRAELRNPQKESFRRNTIPVKEGR